MTDRDILAMLKDLRAASNLDGMMLSGSEWALLLAYIEWLEAQAALLQAVRRDIDQLETALDSAVEALK